MRTTSSVQFYCRDSKANKSGLAPIEASITINGTRSFLSLPAKERPEVFNAKKQPKHITRYLDEWRVKFIEMQSELMANGLPLTIENLKSVIRTGGVQTYKISTLATDFLKDLKHRAECAVYRKYELEFERIIKEIGDIEVTQVTNAQIARHYETLKKAYKPATSASMFQKCRSLFKFAVANGKLRTNPCTGVKITKGKAVIDYLTKEEIETIAKYDFGNESLERVRDLFIFQCASGMAYIDTMRLKPGDISEHNGRYYIRKERQKTGTEYVAVLIGSGYDIYCKYNGNLPRISNQKYNAYLKVIGNIVGISKNLHTHICRHSYAMLLLNSGIRLETVSKALGHSSTAITQAHYARLVATTVVDEVSRAFAK